MNKYKISEEEFAKVSLKRLANNPSAKSNYDRSKLNAEQLKARMDEPLKLFKEKLNAIAALIYGEGDDSADAHMPTGIKEGHTYKQLVSDIVSQSAVFAGYLSVGDMSLLKKLEAIEKVLENTVAKGELEGEVAKFNERADTAIAEFEQSGEEAIERIAEAAVEVEAAVDEAITAVNSRVEELEKDLQTLYNFTPYEEEIIFKSGARFKGEGYYPYCMLAEIEGSDEQTREHNLIPLPYYYLYDGQTVCGGVKVTFDEENRIILNGKSTTSNTYWIVNSGKQFWVEPGKYFLSGCPKGGSDASYYMKVSVKDDYGDTVYQKIDYGSGVVVNLTGLEYRSICIGIYIRSGYTFKDVVFEPQFEPGDSRSEYHGLEYSEAGSPPTRIMIKSYVGDPRERIVFEYELSDALLEFFSENENYKYGLSGNKIDLESKRYIQNNPTEDAVDIDISGYMDGGTLYFRKPDDADAVNVVELYCGDKLLRHAKCKIVMQREITTKE